MNLEGPSPSSEVDVGACSVVATAGPSGDLPGLFCKRGPDSLISPLARGCCLCLLSVCSISPCYCIFFGP